MRPHYTPPDADELVPSGGTAGQVLTNAAPSDPVWADAGGGGADLVASLDLGWTAYADTSSSIAVVGTGATNSFSVSDQSSTRVNIEQQPGVFVPSLVSTSSAVGSGYITRTPTIANNLDSQPPSCLGVFTSDFGLEPSGGYVYFDNCWIAGAAATGTAPLVGALYSGVSGLAYDSGVSAYLQVYVNTVTPTATRVDLTGLGTLASMTASAGYTYIPFRMFIDGRRMVSDGELDIVVERLDTGAVDGHTFTGLSQSDFAANTAPYIRTRGAATGVSGTVVVFTRWAWVHGGAPSEVPTF